MPITKGTFQVVGCQKIFPSSGREHIMQACHEQLPCNPRFHNGPLFLECVRCLAMADYLIIRSTLAFTNSKSINLSLMGLCPSNASVEVFCCSKSLYNFLPFSQSRASVMLSTGSCFSFNHTNKRFIPLPALVSTAGLTSLPLLSHQLIRQDLYFSKESRLSTSLFHTAGPDQSHECHGHTFLQFSGYSPQNLLNIIVLNFFVTFMTALHILITLITALHFLWNHTGLNNTVQYTLC